MTDQQAIVDPPNGKQRQRPDVDKSGRLPRLPLGRMSKPHSSAAERIKLFRRQLESAVAERITDSDADSLRCLQLAARIDTAVRGARLVLRLEAIIERNGDPGSSPEWTHERFLAYGAQLLRAKESVDRAVRDLGELAPMPDPWTLLQREQDALLAEQEAALASPTDDNAAGQGNGHLDGSDATEANLDGLRAIRPDGGNVDA